MVTTNYFQSVADRSSDIALLQLVQQQDQELQTICFFHKTFGCYVYNIDHLIQLNFIESLNSFESIKSKEFTLSLPYKAISYMLKSYPA